MNFTLHIWRQKNAESLGDFVTYQVDNIDGDTSFLEMLDQLNEQLIEKSEDCVVFDYDCREGICGTCSLVINGHPHGEKNATATCQLYMRDYANQSELWIEPFRASSFPVIKDLAVERDAFDRIIQAGGFISVSTGSAPEANSQLVSKDNADNARSLVKNVASFIESDQSSSKCDCKTSLESAIITSPEARDKDLVKKLEAVAGRLLNST